MDEKVTLCKMPWHAICLSANGDIKPCCQFTNKGRPPNTEYPTIMENWNSPRMQELRSAMLRGEKPADCKSCWEREEQIGHSRRIWFEEKFGKYITEPTTDIVVDNPQIVQADINLSNVCNLKCRMCGSWASNSWFEEEITLANKDKRYQKNNKPVPLRNTTVEDIQNLLPHLKDVKRIDFKGGEPMMAKHHDDFLQWLIDEGKTDVHLLYTTNGTVQNPRILKLLSHFDTVSLVFSIEATGSRYSYIRGGKYTIEQLEDVISKYNDLPDVHINFNVTVQNYNLLNLVDLRNQLYSWADKYDKVDADSAFTTICNQPNYLSPLNVPDKLRDIALEQLDGISDFKKLCDSLRKRKFDLELWQTFMMFTQDLDNMRGDNIMYHCPEFAEYFND